MSARNAIERGESLPANLEIDNNKKEFDNFSETTDETSPEHDNRRSFHKQQIARQFRCLQYVDQPKGEQCLPKAPTNTEQADKVCTCDT